MRPSKVALLGLTLLALTGCSATPTPIITPTSFDLGTVQLDDPDRNGVEFLSGTDAFAQVLAAARTARTVSMEGDFDELLPPPEGARASVPGLTISIDLQGSANDYYASVTAGDVSGEVRVQGGDAAANGNDLFRTPLGLESDGAAWSCVPGGPDQLANWQPLLDPIALLESLLKTEEGSDIVVSTGAVVDDTVELVIGSGGATIGTLVVSAVGPPLPISLTAGDSSGFGTFTFSDWGFEPDLDGVDAYASC